MVLISMCASKLFILCAILLSLIDKLHLANITHQSQAYFGNPYSHSYGKPRSLGCDTTVTQKEGWIFSPNFPNNYYNSIECNYNVVKYSDDVCSIELTLTDFDVESSVDCSADYLDLGDGSRRMCGPLIADTRKIISFPTNGQNIKMLFKSNYNINRKGFMAKISQLKNSCPPYVMKRIPSQPNRMHVSESVPQVFEKQPIYLGSYCDIYIGEVVGDLRSPGYPYSYHSNQSCVYSIRRAASDICKVELIFHQFDVSSDGKLCDRDYVELPDRSRVCGIIPLQKRVYPFSRSSDYLILKFNSDDVVDKNVIGFWIEVQQIRNSCDLRSPQDALKCDQVITGKMTTLHSPSYPRFYGPSQQCIYLVEPLDKNVCEYELEFLNFDIESTRDYSGKCNKDFIQLADGSRVCGYFSGKKTYDFPKFRDRIAMFFFTSDEKQEGRGFEIRVNQLSNSCFQTHNYGFDIRPTVITSTPRPYITTDYNVLPNNTFNNCDQIIGGEIAVITSPNYPQSYPTTVRCIYTFIKSVPGVCQMRFKILDLDIEHTRDCHNDYLLIEPTGQRFCGQFIQTEDKIVTFPSYSHEMRLIFNSDRQTTRPGFRLRAEQLPHSCTNPIVDAKAIVEEIPIPDRIVIDQPINKIPVNSVKSLPQICSSSSAIVSTFQSDNYPLSYNAYTNCVYRLFRASPRVCRLEIDFQDFDVGVEDTTHNYCTNGYIEINLIKYCGRRKGDRIIVDFGPEKQDITIRFHTESAVRYGGFRIQVRQVDDNCQHNHIVHEFSPATTETCNKFQFSEKTLQILSPHYDSGSYRPFLDCEYLIRKANNKICALEVRFDAFALEESKSCHKDYLQIETMKLCGKLPYAATRTYEFTSDEISIKFHTDGDVSDAGFVILVQQIQC